MDVKQNIQKAVEDGGFVDLRRIQKANSQLEYQPNLTQFLGGGTGIEQQKEPFETQEYKDMMRKQRDTDSKSDRLVSSSMSIFKKYTEVTETIKEKVKKLRQSNKNARDNQRNQANSTEIMPVESELKKKQFVFPPQPRGGGEIEGEYQKINSRAMMRDDTDATAIATVERSQRGGSIIIQSRTNNNSSVMQQMTIQDQQLQGQTTPTDSQEKNKFDFHQINSKVQLKKRENVINKQIGNLPRDIQAISDIQEDIKDERQALNNFSAEDTFDRSKVDWVQGDVTEAFSVAYVFPKNSIQKSTHNLFFYRDLAPISRFLMKFSNLNGKEQQAQQQKYSQGFADLDLNNNNNPNSLNNNNLIDQASNAELIQQDEIAFNIRELSYSNISDVIGGRIVEDQLAKYDNNVLSIDELPLRIQQKVQELIKVSIDAQLKALPILQASSSSTRFPNLDDSSKNLTKNTSSNSPEKAKPPQAMSKEQIRNAIKQKQHSDQSSQIDQPLMNSPIAGMSLSKLNSQTDLTPEQRKTQTELLQLHGQTDQILNRIGEIKSRKDDLKFIKDSQEYVSNYKELKKELQACLNGLLFMILKTDINPNPSVTSKNSDIELQVSQLLQNLDKIQGTKTTDGHLKSALLLTFLEEYKWIKQEDQLNKMDFDSSFPTNNKDSSIDPKNKGNSNGSNNNSSSNTFANFYHNGQDKKAGSRSTTGMNSNLNSGFGTPSSNSQSQAQLQAGNTKNNPSRFNASSSSSKSPNQSANAKENTRVSENALDTRSRSDQNKKPIVNKKIDNMQSSNYKDSYARKQSSGGINQNNNNNNNSSSIQSAKMQRSVSPNNTNNSSGGWNIQRMSTTHSYVEQTPQKGNNMNQSNLQRNNLSPISQRQQSQMSMQPSSSSSMLRHNASSRSISPISASKRNLRVAENDQKKYILQTANIPGIKKGQNSEINKSYLLERSVSPTLSKRK